MAASKKRKGAKYDPKRAVAAARPKTGTVFWNARLNGSRLQMLRQNEDFVNLIKMGRAMNGVFFNIDVMKDNIAEDTPRRRRQSRRAFFYLGGEIHEALQVARSIQGRYLGQEPFEPLRLLVHDTMYKKHRDYIKAVRNNAAFHHDQLDVSTRQTLKEMKLTWYDLMSGHQGDTLSQYFEFADIVDMGNLVRRFGSVETWGETAKEIQREIFHFATEFGGAGSSFVQHLMEATNIKEHVKAGVFIGQPEEPELEEIIETAEAAGEEGN